MEVEDSIITQILEYISKDSWNYSERQLTTIRKILNSGYSNYLKDFLQIIKGRFPIPFNDFVEILTRMRNTEATDATPFKHINNDDNEFVCARLNDIDDTHRSLKEAFFSDQGKSAVAASLGANGLLPQGTSLSSSIFRFISFLVVPDESFGGMYVYKIPTHHTQGFVVSDTPPLYVVVMHLAKKAARECKVIGITGPVCIHYDLYYDRSAAQGGLFHRDTGDNVKTLHISLEYFINPFVVGGTSMPGVLLGPEIVKYVGSPDTTEFSYGETVPNFPAESLRVLILDGNTVILNNKNIHATPAVVGHMPNGVMYRFQDPRRIDLQQQQGNPLYGNRSIAMQSIGQTRSFIRGWVTDITYINTQTQTLINFFVDSTNEMFREIDPIDIIGGGNTHIKLNEFRLTGIPAKIVFKDEPIITDPDVIKKMISNEMTQLISLIIFSITNKKARQKPFTKRNSQTKYVISRQKPFTKRNSRTKYVISRQKPFTKHIHRNSRKTKFKVG